MFFCLKSVLVYTQKRVTKLKFTVFCYSGKTKKNYEKMDLCFITHH